MTRFTLTFVAATLAASAALASPTAGMPKDPFDTSAITGGGGGGGGGNDIGVAMKGIAGSMGDLTTKLGAEQTDSPVQLEQKDVTGKLDTIIAALDQECNGKAGGGNPNPLKGLRKSILTGGPGGQGELHDAKAGEKQWGTLKPKERDQILQSKTDGFPAGYESLLQSYYRRLSAEDNSAPASDAKPAANAPKADATKADAPKADAKPDTKPADKGPAHP